MGILAFIAGPLPNGIATASTPLVLATGATVLLLLSIAVNVLRQLFSKDPTEPPVVFHWVPFIGSTIPYGIDPYKFFFDCRKKVWACLPHTTKLADHTLARRCVHLHYARAEDDCLCRHKGQ